MDLIDPMEGDERTVMQVALKNGDGTEKGIEALDLCEDCRPESLGAHMDWMTHQMEMGES